MVFICWRILIGWHFLLWSAVMIFALRNTKDNQPMKRINREFCLTDSTVNCYGYRLLTDGLELDRYRPPVGFLMHDREKGVAVQWTDFRREGDALFATPVVNDTLFPELAQQIEEGFINAASVGHIVALEVSDDVADKLPGQDGPTVKRWFPREISLVDIPGNYNALGQLFDENDNVLHDLSARVTNNRNMNYKEIFTDLQSEDEAEVKNYLIALRDKAQKADSLQKELDALRAENASAEVRTILDKAVGEHRITQQLADCLANDYVGRKEALLNLLDKMPAKKTVPQPAEPRKTDDTLAALSWDELDRRGLLPTLKRENKELMAKKFFEKFGQTLQFEEN